MGRDEYGHIGAGSWHVFRGNRDRKRARTVKKRSTYWILCYNMDARKNGIIERSAYPNLCHGVAMVGHVDISYR